MPRIDPALKKQLMDEGRWGDFVRRRQDLKAQGITGTDAHFQTLKEFLPDLPPSPPPKRYGRKKGSKNKPKVPGVEKTKKAAPAIPHGGAVPQGGDGLSSFGPSSPVSTTPPAPLLPADPVTGRRPLVPAPNLPALPVVTAETFKDKQASEVDVVRWVAANMMIQDPDPVDCPSAAAWSMLVQCRESGHARGEFWKMTFPKLLPSRAQMEADLNDVPDEGRAKEAIDDLLGFKDEAEAAYPSDEDGAGGDEEQATGSWGDLDPPDHDNLGEEDENGIEILPDGAIPFRAIQPGEF